MRLKLARRCRTSASFLLMRQVKVLHHGQIFPIVIGAVLKALLPVCKGMKIRGVPELAGAFAESRCFRYFFRRNSSARDQDSTANHRAQ